jgi:hypothetical protein
MYPIDDKKQRVYLRAEAVIAMINLVGPDDPVETFDSVMLLHKVKYPE